MTTDKGIVPQKSLSSDGDNEDRRGFKVAPLADIERRFIRNESFLRVFKDFRSIVIIEFSWTDLERFCFRF